MAKKGEGIITVEDAEKAIAQAVIERMTTLPAPPLTVQALASLIYKFQMDHRKSNKLLGA